MEKDLTTLIRLYDKEHNEVPIKKGFPGGRKYETLRIKGANACYAMIEAKAVFIFQCISLQDLEICISDYRITESVDIYCEADCENAEYHNMILGRVLYRSDGFDWRGIEAGQYNLIYRPFISNKVHFFNVHVRTFGVRVTRQRLSLLAEKYPALKQVSASVRAEQSSSLFAKYSSNSLRSAYLIGEMLDKAEATGTSGISYASVLELAEELSMGKPVKSKYSYTKDDARVIYRAAKYIEEHLGDEDIWKKLDRNSLHPDKFREGFKLMFANNPKNFIFRKKMEKAKKLINEKTKLTDIAVILGYNNISHLATAFLRYYTYSIKDYKHQLQDNSPEN